MPHYGFSIHRVHETGRWVCIIIPLCKPLRCVLILMGCANTLTNSRLEIKVNADIYTVNHWLIITRKLRLHLFTPWEPFWHVSIKLSYSIWVVYPRCREQGIPIAESASSNSKVFPYTIAGSNSSNSLPGHTNKDHRYWHRKVIQINENATSQ